MDKEPTLNLEEIEKDFSMLGDRTIRKMGNILINEIRRLRAKCRNLHEELEMIKGG